METPATSQDEETLQQDEKVVCLYNRILLSLQENEGSHSPFLQRVRKLET